MRRPDPSAVRRPAPAGARRLLFLLFAGSVLALTGAAPALSQAEYTGLPLAAPQDAYVMEAYVATLNGASPGVAPPLGGPVRPPVPAPLAGSGGTVSVASASLDDAPPAADQGDRRLVTGWDVITITALGLTAVVAFATSAARFRSP